MIRPTPFHRCLTLVLCACLLPLLFMSCRTLLPQSHEKDFDNLERILRLYNNEFESRSDRAGAMWVRDDLKADYMTQIKEVHDRITFMNSQVLSIVFLQNGKMVSQAGSRPEEDFDEAVVRTRYEFVRSPSVSLQDRIIEQRWIKQNGIWKIVPNLKAFFE